MCIVSVGSRIFNSEAAKASVGLLRHRGAGDKQQIFLCTVLTTWFLQWARTVRQELNFMHILDESVFGGRTQLLKISARWFEKPSSLKLLPAKFFNPW
jgi:hypothetical protein